MLTPRVPPTLIDVPALAPAGVGRLDVYIDGKPVADLDIQMCADCRRGIIHHVWVDKAHRRSGLGTLAITTMLERHPDFTWSTIPFTDTPATQAFWATIDIANVGTPVTCRHMRNADGPEPPRRSGSPSWSAPRR